MKNLERKAEEIRNLEKQLLEEINADRKARGKEPLEIDTYFIDELQKQLERSIIE